MRRFSKRWNESNVGRVLSLLGAVCLLAACGPSVEGNGLTADPKVDAGDASSIDAAALPDGAADAGTASEAGTERRQVFGSLPGTTPFDVRSPGSSNVALDVNDKIRIQGTNSTAPRFVWSASAASGTVSKVDVGTTKQVARYCTAPGCRGEPRSLALRTGDGGLLVVDPTATSPSVTLVAVDKKSCVDRNGNGVIDTFEGEGDVSSQFRWSSNQTESPDECVVWRTVLDKDRTGAVVSGDGTEPRSIAVVESRDRLYVTLQGTGEIAELDGKDGRVLQQVRFPGRPSGSAVEKTRPVVWMNDAVTGRVVAVDTSVRGLPGRAVGPETPCAGSLAVDGQGLVYSAGGDCVARLDPKEATPAWITLQIPGSRLTGLVVDDASTLWASDETGGAHRIVRADTTLSGPVRVGTVSSPYLGATVDGQGRPWFTASAAARTCSAVGATTLHLVDPTAGTTTSTTVTADGSEALVGRSPATSPHARAIYRLRASETCGTGAEILWKSVAWQVQTPSGTKVSVRYRTYGSDAATPTSPFLPVTLAQAPSLRALGRDLELEFLLESDGAGVTPLLESVAFVSECGGSCANKVKDPGEDAVDCGGTCARCTTGCANDDACGPGRFCDAGTCSAGTCTDGKRSGDESDVDCGGSCAKACEGGKTCRVSQDCASSICRADGTCYVPCLGADCSGDGKACETTADCTSGTCVGGACVPSTCTNASKDGAETDVDCGGTCARCADTKACTTGSDCASGTCTAGTCRAATCGSGAGDCLEGVRCSDGADCASGRCETGVCRGVSCSAPVVPGVFGGAHGNTVCATSSTGGLACWGDNRVGQVGIGSTSSQATPSALLDVGAGLRTRKAAGGTGFTCALLGDGAIKCWGLNALGQLGLPGSAATRAPSSAIALGGRATELSAGATHACAILADGSLRCWGSASSGGLGDGTTGGVDGFRASPVLPTLPTGRTATAVAAGSNHTCAVLDDGALQCWGDNTFHQLGDGTTTPKLAPGGAAVALGAKALSVAAGQLHTCALLEGGAVKCWGSNTFGQLGDASTTDRTTPVPVTLGSAAKAVSAGFEHTCAILSDDSLRCWGNNAFGRLGDGTGMDRSSPTPVTFASGRTVKQVTTGRQHTCALLDDGNLHCWGSGSFGQLGIGSTPDLSAPGQAVTLGF